ncbi:quinone oxidoreductase family protein [Mesorhizobium sangaii]|uniref:NADPH2:quinone reductase n=1 Tax=Mesorhizobium sangaii TaxID=505389 RepID=A0A841P6H5_9HYPH|nr:zinc-binding alcohol dehydrogenase family protein [Mesorhizobium sangaii]MBB6408943.1 NADPH2:quinone reductase [Mesorhizobium sangaii]
MQSEMRSIVVSRYGGPDVLEWKAVPVLALGASEIRIRTIAAAVNHTDLEVRAGNWPIRKPDPFPYVPGVEVVGEVVETGGLVARALIGQKVITMMQGLGGVRADRPGGYAEFVTVKADAAAQLPVGTDPVAMAAIGLAGVTAHEGLRPLGPLKGRQVMVTGAAGGVGSAAVSLASALGAHVLGIVSRPEQADYVRSLGAGRVLASRAGELSLVEPESVDGVFDTVGGAVFETSLSALKPDGTLSLVGAVGGSDVRFDLWNLIRPVSLTGYSSESLDGAALEVAVATLARLAAQHAMQTPKWTTMPLSDASRAHTALEQGGIKGRILLVP